MTARDIIDLLEQAEQCETLGLVGSAANLYARAAEACEQRDRELLALSEMTVKEHAMVLATAVLARESSDLFDAMERVREEGDDDWWAKHVGTSAGYLMRSVQDAVDAGIDPETVQFTMRTCGPLSFKRLPGWRAG